MFHHLGTAGQSIITIITINYKHVIIIIIIIAPGQIFTNFDPNTMTLLISPSLDGRAETT